MLTLKTRKIILALAAIQLFIILFLSLQNQIYTWDEGSYIINGLELSKEKISLVLEKYVAHERHPLLSWIIAGMIKVGLPLISYKFISFVSLLLLLLLTYKMGMEFFDRDIALTASFLLSTIPAVIFLSAKVLTDIPSTLLFSFALYLYYVGLEKPRNFLWGGLVGGISIMMKDLNFLLLPILLVFMIAFWKKINLKYFVGSSVIAFISMLPYFIDNYLRWGNPLYRIIAHIQMVNEGVGYSSFSILNHPIAWLFILPILLGLPLFILFVMHLYQRKRTWYFNPQLRFLLIWFFVPFFIFLAKQKINPRLIGMFLIPVVLLGSYQLIQSKKWKMWLISCLLVNGFLITPLVIYPHIHLTSEHQEAFAFVKRNLAENETISSNASPPSVIAWYSNRITVFNLDPDDNETVNYYLFDKTYEKYTQRTNLNPAHYHILFENRKYILYQKINKSKEK